MDQAFFLGERSKPHSNILMTNLWIISNPVFSEVLFIFCIFFLPYDGAINMNDIFIMLMCVY